MSRTFLVLTAQHLHPSFLALSVPLFLKSPAVIDLPQSAAWHNNLGERHPTKAMASDGLVSIHDPRLSMLEETPFTPTPLLRSLSKSSPRDPTAKLHPPPKLPAPRTEDDIKVQPQSVQDDQSIWPSDDATSAPAANLSTHPQSYLEDLPAEIQELIAGYVVGRLGSTNSGTGGSEKVIKNWNEHMRHPRRRNVADLALVSPIWRNLIQERLYRHSTSKCLQSAW